LPCVEPLIELSAFSSTSFKQAINDLLHSLPCCYRSSSHCLMSGIFLSVILPKASWRRLPSLHDPMNRGDGSCSPFGVFTFMRDPILVDVSWPAIVVLLPLSSKFWLLIVIQVVI